MCESRYVWQYSCCYIGPFESKWKWPCFICRRQAAGIMRCLSWVLPWNSICCWREKGMQLSYIKPLQSCRVDCVTPLKSLWRSFALKSQRQMLFWGSSRVFAPWKSVLSEQAHYFSKTDIKCRLEIFIVFFSEVFSAVQQIGQKCVVFWQSTQLKWCFNKNLTTGFWDFPVEMESHNLVYIIPRQFSLEKQTV